MENFCKFKLSETVKYWQLIGAKGRYDEPNVQWPNGKMFNLWKDNDDALEFP